jgi:hypothetical protein
VTKTVGKFTFDLIAARKGVQPFNAIIRIGLKSWSTGEDGWPCLTPHLMTDKEIDYHLNALKADLDRVGRVANQALKRANEKTLANVGTSKAVE